jgi:hypothetical protein
VRSHAKASSVGSSKRQNGRMGGLTFLLALFAILLLAVPAFASKQIVDFVGDGFGVESGKGGNFDTPRDIAANTTGAGPANQGDFYVGDEYGVNSRIQRFDEDGNFISAWGANVLTAPTDEVQKLTVSASAGTYKLSFDGATTADIAFDAGAGEVGSALSELPTTGAAGISNLELSGDGPYTITFKNDFNSSMQATDVPQIGVDTSQLTGTASVETITQGSGQYEICTVAANCRVGAASGAPNAGDNAKNGSLNSPSSIAVDQDTGNVYVADRNNRRINEYSGDGTFIRSFGWGVDASTPGEGYEVCPATDRCTYGIAGSGVGQIGRNQFTTMGITVSPPDGNSATGTVFLADPQSRRVDTYDLDGQNPSSFGSEAQFDEGQPTKVAVDSRGIVYASNSKNNGEIERYDTEDANGGGVGFFAPIAVPPLLEGPSEGEGATRGLAVDADSDGAGTDEDVLYVLRGSWSSGGVVQQFGPTNDPGLTTPPTAVDDTHGTEAGFETGSIYGLGLDDASGQIFVSASGNVGGLGGGNRVYILDNSVAPGASIDPVTTFDAHSATFSGEVDPNSTQTGYRFEYVDDSEFQANGFANAKQVPLTDRRIGDGDDPVSVQHKAPGLIANTTYHVRLVAKQTFTSTQTIAGPITFTTDASAPSIDGTAATISTDEATLRGTIDPENQAVTDYHFEWGLTPSYDNTTPSASLPVGKAPVAVSALLSGLTPGATYHYRLVATNASGTTQGPDRTFTTYASLPSLGPARAFELVSPYPTGGVPIIANTAKVTISEDGNRVNFGMGAQPFPGTELVPPPDHLHNSLSHWRYGSVRGPDGWHVEEYGLAATLGGTYPFFGSGVSADGTRYLFATEAGTEQDPRFDPDDKNGSLNVYNTAIDVYQRQPDGSLVWISRDPRIPVGTPQFDLGNAMPAGEMGMAEMSVDGSTAVFLSRRPLSDEDTATTSPTANFPNDLVSLYKWQEGQLSFIGKRPDGSVPDRGTRLGDFGVSGLPILQGTVSRDGSRVLFSAQRTDSTNSGGAVNNHTLYIQTDGQPTVEAVKETGVPPLPADQPFNVTYRGASADLSRAFFTSASRLTVDSGAGATSGGDADLYVYDIGADKVRDLTPRLDGIDDPSVDPAIADRGRARGLVTNSEDGKRVYFVADAQYDTAPNPEGELPSPEGRNLYLAELDGIDDPIKLRFVAALGPADETAWQATLNFGDGRSSYASPNGSVLGFGSSEPLTGQALGGTEQLFVYDAQADTLECASCPADGSLPAGDVNLRIAESGGGQVWQTENAYRRWVSTDGSVFFHTRSQLVDGDTNLVDDVYEYRGGSLRLVSAGTGTLPSRLENVSRDGSTVVIDTSDALVPEDEEPGISKLYAARVGGGLPFSPKPAACDLGAGACEGTGTGAAQQPGAGSAAFEGAGDSKPKNAGKHCPKGKRKVRRKGKVRCATAKSHKHKRDAKNDRGASR